MPIPFECPNCGLKGNASDQVAGKRAKCKCGSLLDFTGIAAPPPVEAPEPQPAPEPAAEPAPAGAIRPGSRFKRRSALASRGRKGVPRKRGVTRPVRREPGKLPGLALGLTIFNFLDALVVGLIMLIVILLGALLSGVGAMGEGMIDDPSWKTELGVPPDSADELVSRVKKNGGEILKDEVVTAADGSKSREIRYKDPTEGGGADMTSIASYPVLSPEQKAEAAREKAEAKAVMRDVQSIGGIIILIGILLLLVAFIKVIAGIGLLMKKNWGRVGLIGLCGLQALFLLIFVIGTGLEGASILLILNLIFNGCAAWYFTTAPVKAATA